MGSVSSTSPRPVLVRPAEAGGDAIQREVAEAFANTTEAYLARCLTQRNPGPRALGSVFREPMTVAQLRDAQWSRFPHPNVVPPFKAYRAAIPGKLGVIPLSELFPQAYVKLVDAKGNGDIEPTVILQRHKLPKVDHSTLIVGPDRDTGKSRVWSFHPGDPNRPPPRHKASLDGEVFTVADAKAVGFEWASVVVR